MSGGYEVRLETSAAKRIQALQRHDQQRVMAAIQALAAEPRPRGCVKLSGTDAGYRIRVGNFRVIYLIDDGVWAITVTRVGHRREVYRR